MLEYYDICWLATAARYCPGKCDGRPGDIDNVGRLEKEGKCYNQDSLPCNVKHISFDILPKYKNRKGEEKIHI